MLTFFSIVHVLLCVFMIFVILLQPGKDAGMGAALGGGAATSAFGGRGAVTFLSKATGIMAAMFFLTSLGLSFVGLRSSVAMGEDEEVPAASAPASTTPPSEGGSSGVTLEQPAGDAPAGQQTEPVKAGPSGTTEETAPAPTPAEGQ